MPTLMRLVDITRCSYECLRLCLLRASYSISSLSYRLNRKKVSEVVLLSFPEVLLLTDKFDK